jgi:hypothetical protein
VAATSNLEIVVADAAFYLIPQLTDELKTAAKIAGWPQEVIDALSIKFDGSSLSVDYPTAMSKTIDDLEYGKDAEPPNPVIRSFIYRSSETVESVLANRSINTLFDLERIFNE